MTGKKATNPRPLPPPRTPTEPEAMAMIDDLRKLMGHPSASALCREIGITDQALQYWRKGTRTPSMLMLSSIYKTWRYWRGASKALEPRVFLRPMPGVRSQGGHRVLTDMNCLYKLYIPLSELGNIRKGFQFHDEIGRVWLAHRGKHQANDGTEHKGWWAELEDYVTPDLIDEFKED